MKSPNRALRLNSQSAFGNRQSAFSFIEVLFAVILLGIGFIMIAGIFPVAIQQTAVVSNETEGTLVIQDAIKKIQALADQPIGAPPSTPGTTNSLFQPTWFANRPTVKAFSINVMQALGSDSFFTADRRYGWVGFYRRDSVTSPFAQVFIIALQNPNFPNYTTRYQPQETTPITPTPPILPTVAPPIPGNTYNFISGYVTPSAPPNPPAPGIGPTITATFTYDPASKITTAIVADAPNAVTGAFVLVSDTNNTAPNMVGRIFRLGSVPPNTGATSGTFYLQPGSDITDADNVSTFNASVFIIGAAPTLGANGEFTGPFTGPNQDIAAGSAFIRVNLSSN